MSEADNLDDLINQLMLLGDDLSSSMSQTPNPAPLSKPPATLPRQSTSVMRTLSRAPGPITVSTNNHPEVDTAVDDLDSYLNSISDMISTSVQDIQAVGSNGTGQVTYSSAGYERERTLFTHTPSRSMSEKSIPIAIHPTPLPRTNTTVSASPPPTPPSLAVTASLKTDGLAQSSIGRCDSAPVSKTIVKIYEDDAETFKCFHIDKSITAWKVVKMMMRKNNCPITPLWCIMELDSDTKCCRILEDHELVVDVISSWPKVANNKLIFGSRNDKFMLFNEAEKYFSLNGGSMTDFQRKNLLEDCFKRDAVACPERAEVLQVAKPGKYWEKCYTILRGSGVYVNPKGTKKTRDVECLVKFSPGGFYPFLVIDSKKSASSPTDYTICLRSKDYAVVKDKKTYLIAFEDAHTRNQWYHSTRLWLFGHQMYETYLAVMAECSRFTGKFGADPSFVDSQASPDLTPAQSYDSVKSPKSTDWHRSSVTSTGSTGSATPAFWGKACPPDSGYHTVKAANSSSSESPDVLAGLGMHVPSSSMRHVPPPPPHHHRVAADLPQAHEGLPKPPQLPLAPVRMQESVPNRVNCSQAPPEVPVRSKESMPPPSPGALPPPQPMGAFRLPAVQPKLRPMNRNSDSSNEMTITALPTARSTEPPPAPCFRPTMPEMGASPQRFTAPPVPLRSLGVAPHVPLSSPVVAPKRNSPLFPPPPLVEKPSAPDESMYIDFPPPPEFMLEGIDNCPAPYGNPPPVPKLKPLLPIPARPPSPTFPLPPPME